jgi:hypothetical protein
MSSQTHKSNGRITIKQERIDEILKELEELQNLNQDQSNARVVHSDQVSKLQNDVQQSRLITEDLRTEMHSWRDAQNDWREEVTQGQIEFQKESHSTLHQWKEELATGQQKGREDAERMFQVWKSQINNEEKTWRESFSRLEDRAELAEVRDGKIEM